MTSGMHFSENWDCLRSKKQTMIWMMRVGLTQGPWSEEAKLVREIHTGC